MPKSTLSEEVPHMLAHYKKVLEKEERHHRTKLEKDAEKEKKKADEERERKQHRQNQDRGHSTAGVHKVRV